MASSSRNHELSFEAPLSLRGTYDMAPALTLKHPLLCKILLELEPPSLGRVAKDESQPLSGKIRNRYSGSSGGLIEYPKELLKLPRPPEVYVELERTNFARE